MHVCVCIVCIWMEGRGHSFCPCIRSSFWCLLDMWWFFAWFVNLVSTICSCFMNSFLSYLLEGNVWICSWLPSPTTKQRSSFSPARNNWRVLRKENILKYGLFGVKCQEWITIGSLSDTAGKDISKNLIILSKLFYKICMDQEYISFWSLA